MDIGLLLYDTERRQPFNKLLNDLEKTFKESINIKEAWLAVKFSTYWKFFKPEDLKQTSKAYVITTEDASTTFSDMTTCA
jgi:Holliday junction resolvase